MMNDAMTFDEIKAKCDGEWVLIGDPVIDKHMQVLSGRLLCHSKDRAEVYQRGKELHPQSAAVMFVGAPAHDAEFLL